VTLNRGLSLAFVFLFACSRPTGPDAGPPPDGGLGIETCGVDVHQHFAHNSSFDVGASSMIEGMEAVGYAHSLVMPPPIADPGTAPEGAANWIYTERSRDGGPSLLETVQADPEHFSLVAGGGILNRWIHGAVVSGIEPDEAELYAFERAAEDILDDGAVGFGEMAALHLSIEATHPFIMIPADHAYLLRLAEVAGRRGVPIDIHAEMVDGVTIAIPDDLPRNALGRSCFRSTANETNPGNNPVEIADMMVGFERLLAHDPSAAIIWSHVGWDNIGHMTTERLRELMSAYPNLYLSLKMLDDPSPGCQLIANRPLDPTDGSLRPEWEALIEDFAERVVIGADTFFGDPSTEPASVAAPNTRGTWALVDRLAPETATMVACENPRRLFGL
jgi:hypothetical protein